MQEYMYTVVLTLDEDNLYCATVPALPGCHTQGKTREDALTYIQDAIALYIQTLIEENIPIPSDSRPDISIETVKVVA